MTKTIKILIAESFDIEALNNYCDREGAVVHYNCSSSGHNPSDNKIHFYYCPDITTDEIEKVIAEYDALMIRPKEVNAGIISAADNLKIIVRGGAGLNSINLEAAAKKGIRVNNTPGANSVSTAEFTFALIMELAAKRHIAESVKDTKTGHPLPAERYTGKELAGQKIAIIGMGHIGSAVAKRAAAFDMEVIYYSRNKKDVPYQYYPTLHELLSAGSDIVSLHIPLSIETNRIISKNELALMKKGTILINTARPQLVDPMPFGMALEFGLLQSAGIDGDYDLIKPFLDADMKNKCIITHHIADSTKQAQEKITNQSLKHIFSFFSI